MTRRRTVAAAVMAAFLFCSLMAAPPASPAAPVTERFVLTTNGSTGAVARLVGLAGGRVDQAFSAIPVVTATLPRAAAAALRAAPGIVAVEPDSTYHLAATTESSPPWGLDRIDQRQLPLNSRYTYANTGNWVRAYVIDSGIRSDHADLSRRVYSGYSVVPGASPYADCLGHGTHVAGTIGGERWGVAKDVGFVSVRVFGCDGDASLSRLVAAMDWVVRHHAAGIPSVANMSLGGPASTAVDTAARAMVADGIVVTVAAGNSGTDSCRESPARVQEVIAVGATDRTDLRPSWSNYGKCTKLHAPGVAVVSAWHSGTTASKSMTGTSMAAPHVAGVAARLLQKYPRATPSAIGYNLLYKSSTGAVRGIQTSCPLISLSPCTAGTPNRLLYSEL